MHLPGQDNFDNVRYMSWQSLSFGITNVTIKKCLHLIHNGEPVVVNGCFSMFEICVYKT